jgi:hypothetical protein
MPAAAGVFGLPRSIDSILSRSTASLHFCQRVGVCVLVESVSSRLVMQSLIRSTVRRGFVV